MPFHPDAERYLNAVFPDHRILDQEAYSAHAQDIKRHAFPALTLPLDFIFFHSRVRSFEQLMIDGRGVVFADRGLAELLSLLDGLTVAQTVPPDAALSLLHIPFTEAFAYQDDVERALLCAEGCLAHRALIEAIRVAIFSKPGHSQLGLALMLHEIAHFLVDPRHPSVAWVLERVEHDLANHSATVLKQSERLHAGDVLPELDSSIADMSPKDRQRLSEQMEEMIAHVRANSETVRETSCDIVAILGLLTLHFGESILDVATPPPFGASLRQACDAVFLGIRLSRQMIAKAFITQTADNICRAANPSVLGPSFAQMTARQNVGTNIARDLVEGLTEKWRLHGMVQPGEPDYIKHFDQSIIGLGQQAASRLMQGVEYIGMLNRSPHIYLAEVKAMKIRLFGIGVPTRKQLRDALDERINQMPF